MIFYTQKVLGIGVRFCSKKHQNAKKRNSENLDSIDNPVAVTEFESLHPHLN